MDLHAEAITNAHVQIARTQYKTTISSGQHTLIADEPASKDGTDLGMAPTTLLLASLGSCTAITLRMYINRKMWIVDEINLDLTLYKIDGGTLIKRKIDFKGDITDEQKKRLEQIADACPVHKILVGNVMIETQLS